MSRITGLTRSRLSLPSGEAAVYHKDVTTGGASGGSIRISAQQLHVSGTCIRCSEIRTGMQRQCLCPPIYVSRDKIGLRWSCTVDSVKTQLLANSSQIHTVYAPQCPAFYITATYFWYIQHFWQALYVSKVITNSVHTSVPIYPMSIICPDITARYLLTV